MENFIHFESQSINLNLVTEIIWNHKDSLNKTVTIVFFVQSTVPCNSGDGGEHPCSDITDIKDRQKLALKVGYPISSLL